MTTLFENEDFILKLTGHAYDFVGIIETKGDKPLTFFFEEELVATDANAYGPTEWEPDESKTQLLDVYKGLKTDDPDNDEEQEITMSYQVENGIDVSHFRTRDDKITGFLSDPRERGQFLALVKNYCPERLKDIAWA
jgi:hypothetical protein